MPSRSSSDESVSANEDHHIKLKKQQKNDKDEAQKLRHLFRSPVPLSLPPTDITLRYIRERNWEAALQRLSVCPADARYSEVPMNSTTTESLLHTACLYRAPNELLERLLLLSNPETVWTRNSQGWIPLHIHITYSTKPCDALIEAGGAKAIRMRWNGGTALHLACRHATRELMGLLLSIAPDSVKIPTRANVYPAELLFRKPFGGTVGQWESLWILVTAWKNYTGFVLSNVCCKLCDLIAFQADCCNPQSNVCIVSIYLDLEQPVSISIDAKRLAARVSTPRVILRLHRELPCVSAPSVDEETLKSWLERRDVLSIAPAIRLEVLETLTKSLDVSGWWNLAHTLDDMYYLLRLAPHGVSLVRCTSVYF